MTLFPVLVDVYLKERLVTREEAEKAASDKYRWQQRWLEVSVTKDASTATRIAYILYKHGFNDGTQYIRGKCVYFCLYV